MSVVRRKRKRILIGRWIRSCMKVQEMMGRVMLKDLMKNRDLCLSWRIKYTFCFTCHRCDLTSPYDEIMQFIASRSADFKPTRPATVQLLWSELPSRRIQAYGAGALHRRPESGIMNCLNRKIGPRKHGLRQLEGIAFLISTSHLWSRNASGLTNRRLCMALSNDAG